MNPARPVEEDNGARIPAMQIEERRAFATIEEAIEDIRQGKFVVVVDAADRENEGDLTIAAQFATPEAVNFMTEEARGLICACLAEARGREPGLLQMTDGNETMARVPDLIPYCERHGLKLVPVGDLIAYRSRHERIVERTTSVRLPTAYGEFTAVAFREKLTGKHHVALVKGEVEGAENVLVRVHSECLTGDVFHSLRCDCGEQLEQAPAQLASEVRGVVLHLSHA